VAAALIVYGLGALTALWRVDGGPLTRISLALLWPLGPLAFVVTVAVLVGAALVAFPVFGAVAALAAGIAWWAIA
jgi:hypothetical protein